MSRRSVLPAVLVLAFVVSCDRAPERPVARLSVEPAEVVLDYPGSAALELVWWPSSPLGEVDGTLRVFVHLLDDDGEIVRTFDHDYPSDWVVGREAGHRLEVYQSALGEPLRAAEYTLTVGLYDGSGRRWALATTGQEVARREYRVATVRVSDEPASEGQTVFVGDWQPLEPGADRQILGRRWTAAPAAIEVDGATETRELVLSLAIPLASPETRLELAEGEREPRLRVASDCDASEHLLAGSGSHQVEVSVPPGAACRVSVDPRFRIVWPQGQVRSVSLDNLYWRTPTGG